MVMKDLTKGGLTSGQMIDMDNGHGNDPEIIVEAGEFVARIKGNWTDEQIARHFMIPTYKIQHVEGPTEDIPFEEVTNLLPSPKE